jgi:2-dehydro-3-deoxyphosphogalactonate aldolase
MERLQKVLDENPIIAILRGVHPYEVLQVADALISSGIRAIEIPFNSPEPLKSIELLANRFSGEILLGCGTVLSSAELKAAHSSGAELALHPHANPQLVKDALKLGMISLPGVMTPTECFAMLEAGASGLKLFPCDVLGPEGVAALKAVLRTDTTLIAVGGISAQNICAFKSAGVDGFALGSSIYKPGMPAADIRTSVKNITKLLASSNLETKSGIRSALI